ncbi:WRKY DNA binding domain containing protein [Rhynchospora pubera]|uniref:WRKY DNA binding domain containing protein n=1 Tax=Rhynchospora pubera TaxID=906938 RepID=A0AAV8HU97_9POAL|nr:WRKY DNA binding domain containing protein [Rhynchospora pubera]
MAPHMGIKENPNCKTEIEELERGCVLTASLEQEVVGSSEADSLLGVITNAFSSSLDNFVKSNKITAKQKAVVLPGSVWIGDANDGGARKRERQDTAPSEQHRKRECISWEVVTCAADHDGYLWRKYGEKKINNSQFSRCYYRCSYYREKNCKAVKQVQRQNNSDPPMYRVTYFYEHTCDIHADISNMPAISYPKLLDFTMKTPSPSCFSTTSSGNVEEKREKGFDTCIQVRVPNQVPKMEFGSTFGDKFVPSGENPSADSDIEIDHDIDFGSIWFDSTDSGFCLD